MFLSKMKLGKKLALGFALVFLMLAIVALIGSSKLDTMNGYLDDVGNHSLKKVEAATDLRGSLFGVALVVRNIGLFHDDVLEKKEKESLEVYRAKNTEAYDRLSKLVSTEKEKQLLQAIQGLRDKIRPAVDKAVALGMEDKDDEVRRIVEQELNAPQAELIAKIGELVDYEDQLAQEVLKAGNSAGTSAKVWMFGTGAAAVVLGALFAFLLIRSVTRSIGRVAAGLTDSSDQVASASCQISSASQALAEGASQQAAALEETTSSLEEISSMTRQNADNATQADNLMKEARRVVEDADGSMAELTQAMEEINQASEETSKIIKTIDEIAFQTNLLALNAAVEAARAGEAGAGFAVVADEVRNLAMRAADAAKNTAGLIEGTVKKVKAGAELVTKTATAFSEVVGTTGKVGELVGEISAASSEQAQGLDQVNKAMAEMDKVVQRNAGNAEENAGASEEMNAQAEQMKTFVSDLIALVGEDGGKPSSGPMARPMRERTSSQRTAALPMRSVKAVGGGKGTRKAIAEAGTRQIVPLEAGDFDQF